MLNKENLDKLKIWWNIAFKENDKEQYDKCERVCNKLIKLNKHRCKKTLKWKHARMNDLLYIPEKYKDENGILSKYYTKDNIVEICDNNKVLGCYVYGRLYGELVEDKYNSMKEQFYEYFIYEPTAKLYKSQVTVNFFRALTEEQQKKVMEVLDEKTGMRKNKEEVEKEIEDSEEEN